MKIQSLMNPHYNKILLQTEIYKWSIKNYNSLISCLSTKYNPDHINDGVDSGDFFGVNENIDTSVEVTSIIEDINNGSLPDTKSMLPSKCSFYKSHFGTIRVENSNNTLSDIKKFRNIFPTKNIKGEMDQTLYNHKNSESTNIKTRICDSHIKICNNDTLKAYKLEEISALDNNENLNNILSLSKEDCKKEKVLNVFSKNSMNSNKNQIGLEGSDNIIEPNCNKVPKDLMKKFSKINGDCKGILNNKIFAVDVAKEIRKGIEKSSSSKTKPSLGSNIGLKELGFSKDSQGFNICTNQVQNWNKVPRYQILEELKKNIIYEDECLLGINKPYGLSTMGDSANLYSIASLSNDLAKVINHSDGLHIVHRLDKDCTGVLLLAKNTQTQVRINEMFRKRQIQKIYWAITVGVPKPSEGIIKIPLVEKEHNGVHKIFVSPVMDDDGRIINQATAQHLSQDGRKGSYREAITAYEVLRNTSSASLIKVEAKTGLKHQVRVHLAYGLNCPILGDHKYSHIHEMKPQRLPDDMLNKLHIRQQKVRTVPLHLHAFSLILPSSLHQDDSTSSSPSSKVIEVTATKLPYHFLTNLKNLGLDLRRSQRD